MLSQSKEAQWNGQFENGTFVRRKKMNRVVLPEEAEDALKNHIYSDRRDAAGHREGYIAVEPEQRDFPVMLFHPDYHKQPEPHPNDFDSTKPQLYHLAKADWEAKFNRTIIAETPERAEELEKKGWLPKPPKIKPVAASKIGTDVI